MSQIDLDQIKITNGQSLSPALSLGDKTICGFHMPAVWTAAALSFQVSPDNGATWNEWLDAKGASQTFAVAQGQYAAVDPALFRGFNMIKLRSGTVGVPVNQGQDSTIIVASKRVM